MSAGIMTMTVKCVICGSERQVSERWGLLYELERSVPRGWWRKVVEGRRINVCGTACREVFDAEKGTRP